MLPVRDSPRDTRDCRQKSDPGLEVRATPVDATATAGVDVF